MQEIRVGLPNTDVIGHWSGDRLDINYINSLPQPLWDGEWPVYDIDVQSGLYRIDVCGKLQVKNINYCRTMTDNSGVRHKTSDFELDSNLWEERVTNENTGD